MGIISGAIYSAIFCGLPFLFWSPTKDLIFLSLWGGFYLAFATTTARVTSSAVFHTLKSTIVPNLSETAATKILEELKKHYEGMFPYFIAYFIAAFAAVVSSIAIYYDLSPTQAERFDFEWLWKGPPRRARIQDQLQ